MPHSCNRSHFSWDTLTLSPLHLPLFAMLFVSHQTIPFISDIPAALHRVSPSPKHVHHAVCPLRYFVIPFYSFSPPLAEDICRQVWPGISVVPHQRSTHSEEFLPAGVLDHFWYFIFSVKTMLALLTLTPKSHALLTVLTFWHVTQTSLGDPRLPPL